MHTHLRPRRRWWATLGVRLFATYLAVLGVAILALWLAIDLVAPPVFELHLRRMMGVGGPFGPGGGPGHGMGMPPSAGLDAALGETFRAALSQSLLLASGAAVLAAVAASVLVTRGLVSPVRRLVRASGRLAAGHYDERVPGGPGEEMGDLAASFNELAAALETTEQRRRELIGDVAHELRTPLATLEGYLEGLLDGVVAPDQRTWAKLRDESARLRRLVDDLQELSRAEAGQIALNLRPIEPSAIARAALDRLAGLWEDKGLTLRVDMQADLPLVNADFDRAVQVLTNLLTNALRYTPAPGEVQLQVAAVPGSVRIGVRDSGVGIAPEHLAHVFERFYRVDKSRSRASGGSGVGLTIARALAEAMGGEIVAASAGAGQGATFSFTLPLARGAGVQLPATRTA